MKKLLLILTLAVIAMTFVSLAACSEAKSDLEDVKWILTSYGPQGDLKTPLADTQITVTFKSDTKDVTGSAGCNSYSGTYVIVGDKLTMVESFGVTEMWCGEEKDVQEKARLSPAGRKKTRLRYCRAWQMM